MDQTSPHDAAQLRRWVYQLVIVIAFAIACGRILSVQRVYEPAFHKDPHKKEVDRRPVWPAARPDSNAMFGSNDRARWATIRSLVHEGTYVVGQRNRDTVALTAATLFAVGDPMQATTLSLAGYDLRTDTSNPRSHSGIIFKPGFKEHGYATIDRVMNPATLEFFSSKPPLLSTLLAGIYWILHHLFGLSLIDHPTIVVRVMLLLVNGLPFAGYLWLLTRITERYGLTDWGRLYVLVAAAFGTTVSPFLITLNNHTIATFAVMLAWWSLLRVWDLAACGLAGFAKPQAATVWPHFALAGLFAAFAVTNEMPALAFLAAVFVLLLWWSPGRTLALFVPMALIPIVAFLATNYLAVGQLKPVQSEFESPWYRYEGSHWNPPPPGQVKFGIDWAKYHETRAEYALHLLVGHHGLFTVTPIWLLALIGMLMGTLRVGALWRQAFFRESTRFPWFVQPLGLSLMIVVVGFYLFKSDNYGGFTNGLRWLMWLTPIWLTCLIPVADWLAARAWGRWLGLLCLAVSIFSMHYQIWSPWRHPWIFDFMLELGWPGY